MRCDCKTETIQKLYMTVSEYILYDFIITVVWYFVQIVFLHHTACASQKWVDKDFILDIFLG